MGLKSHWICVTRRSELEIQQIRKGEKNERKKKERQMLEFEVLLIDEVHERRRRLLAPCSYTCSLICP